MIGTVLRIGWLTLKRDRIAQLLSFVLPVIFFSVFAVIFGGMGPDHTSRVTLAVVDEDGSDASRRFVKALQNDPSLRVILARGNPPQTLTRETARELVIDNADVSVAAILKPGFAEQFGGFRPSSGDAPDASIDLLAETTDPIASQMTAGLLQRAAMVALPDLMMKSGVDMLAEYGGPLTEGQQGAISSWLALIRRENEALTTLPATNTPAPDKAAPASNPFSSGLVRVNTVDLLAATPDKSPVRAFYAAGVAVLFLLFSTMGCAGILLEEQAHGTLERLLVSKITMGQLLLGRWCYVTLLALTQLVIMFLWGWAVFGVNLWTPTHLAGFAAMSLVTAAAAASFGLILATACRTRAQLDGIGTIVILLMSAIGGSMFPRFLMPDWMKNLGLLTFNGWALDGFQKVFWYDKTVPELWPQLTVLAALAVTFFLVARLLARRWETT